ncbi:TPA: polysaccharide pyruvyl transferase family protein [Streptococcus suis]|nr:polysaccharide pyruvyl transferase family protein [Streptococcus suis]
MTKYALFSYTTGNIGDEIQSVATSRFLPRIDYFINRDYMNEFQAETDEEIKIIMNGWYSHRPENFPPKQSYLHPLLISMYVDEDSKSLFSSPENRAFFTKHGPVGARSIDTRSYFEGLGVESYLSHCMTLTIQSEPGVKKQDIVLAIDLPNAVYDKLARESVYPVIRMSADINHQYMSPSQRMKVAQYYLYLYQSARFVVTTRLHGTLPCLALGTPVLNIQEQGFEEGRFAGLRELANHMTVEEFLAGACDVNQPLPNPQKHLDIRKELEERCQAFTGFKSEAGYLNGQEVTDFLMDPELVQAIVTGLWSAYQYYGIYR